MNYRCVYRDDPGDRKVLTCVENESNTVTSSNEKFIIDDLDSISTKLSSWGVDISFLWNNDLISRFIPNGANPEIEVSSHPNFPEIERRVFGHSLSVEYPNKQFRFNMIVRHFDNGNYDNSIHDDEFVSTIVDNSVLVDDGNGNQIGEYNFFLSLINQGIPLTQLQNQRIPTMDSNGFFTDIYS